MKNEAQMLKKLTEVFFCDGKNGIIKGIGDDCAVIEKNRKQSYVITVDGMKENIHFLKDEKLETVMHKLFVRNISDIYAMGAHPLYCLIHCALPKKDINISINILRSLSKNFSIEIIGGDTTISDERSMSMFLIGIQNNRSIYYRSNAKIGDSVYLSSYTGLSYYGLNAVKKNIKGFYDLKREYLYFSLPSKEFLGEFINNNGIHSAIDISDGLLKDAERIAVSSGVSLQIDVNKIPVHPHIKRISKILRTDPMIGVLNGGDDYEILFTGCPDLGFAHEIGRVSSGYGLLVEGSKVEGYDHFER